MVFHDLMDDPALANDPFAALARQKIMQTAQCDASTFGGSRVTTPDQMWVMQEQIRTMQAREITDQRQAEQTRDQLSELGDKMELLCGSTSEQAEILRAQIDGAQQAVQANVDMVSGTLCHPIVVVVLTEAISLLYCRSAPVAPVCASQHTMSQLLRTRKATTTCCVFRMRLGCVCLRYPFGLACAKL